MNTMQVIPYQSAGEVLGVDFSKPRPTIRSLPDELLLEIFSYIKPYDRVFTLPNVCRGWREVSVDRSLKTEAPGLFGKALPLVLQMKDLVTPNERHVKSLQESLKRWRFGMVDEGRVVRRAGLCFHPDKIDPVEYAKIRELYPVFNSIFG